MTFEQIYNLMRPADKKGSPINDQVTERRMKADYLGSRDDAANIFQTVLKVENDRKKPSPTKSVVGDKKSTRRFV